ISFLVAVREPEYQQQVDGGANLVRGPWKWETIVTYSPATAQAANIPWYGPNETQFVNYYSKQSNAGSPTYHSGEDGAAVVVLADAMQTANSTDTTNVRQAISNMHIVTFLG